MQSGSDIKAKIIKSEYIKQQKKEKRLMMHAPIQPIKQVAILT